MAWQQESKGLNRADPGCAADLRADFGGRKHELNVSTYQMAILVLFNTADSLSYLELQAATNIPAADLKRSLQSLACAKVRTLCLARGLLACSRCLDPSCLRMPTHTCVCIWRT